MLGKVIAARLQPVPNPLRGSAFALRAEDRGRVSVIAIALQRCRDLQRLRNMQRCCYATLTRKSERTSGP
ncbi:MAG: hypothetical protein ACUVRV_08975 [Cyanobacteriota bacterium]